MQRWRRGRSRSGPSAPCWRRRCSLLRAQTWKRSSASRRTTRLPGGAPPGTNRDDSDFDLLLILPDTVPENLAGQAMGQVWQTAQTRGHVVDHQKIAAATWSEPEVVNAPIVNEVKRFGVWVP